MAAQYEKRVLTMDAWGQKQGYPPLINKELENKYIKRTPLLCLIINKQ